MEYLSPVQVSRLWRVSPRQVQRLLAQNRVPGARRHGRTWLVPADAIKPSDPRQDGGPIERGLADDLRRVFEVTALPLPGDNPDAFLASLEEHRLARLIQADLDYLRGDFALALACFYKTAGDEVARLRACPVAIAAAISLDDYSAYKEIEAYLRDCIGRYPGGTIAAIADLSLATAAVSVMAPNMAPEWLKKGDLSALALPVRPDALYLRAKYLQCLGKYEAMLAVGQTALALCPQGITTPGLYLRLVCAMACHALGDKKGARGYLLDAMDIALPHGFTTPFAELITAFGGLMEECLEAVHPGSYGDILSQWKQTWKNWIHFHNQFTKENITLILSLREYHIAALVARRVPYAKIAGEYNISVGRLKNIVLEIYGKLFISSRDELAKYIL